MADTILPKAQAVALLQKLSTDDKFRASYQANPRDALLGIGISADLLPKTMSAVTTLASKAAFQHALALVDSNDADCYGCQVPPHVRLHLGR